MTYWKKIVPTSKVSEGDRMLPFEVKLKQRRSQTTIADLSDYLDDDYDDIDSHRQWFFPNSNGKRISGYIFKSHYNGQQDKSQKLENRKPVKIVFHSDMMLLRSQSTLKN